MSSSGSSTGVFVQQWPALSSMHHVAFSVPTFWLLQITMNNYKFDGFKRAVLVMDQSKVILKNCLVELTMKGDYGGERNVGAAMRNYFWEDPSGHLVQLLITCRAYSHLPLTFTDPWRCGTVPD
jgi:hypothetical protein